MPRTLHLIKHGPPQIVSGVPAHEWGLAPDALEGSVFRMLRQGQRVIFDVDGATRATRLRLGSEVDMGTPGFGGIPDIPPQSD